MISETPRNRAFLLSLLLVLPASGWAQARTIEFPGLLQMPLPAGMSFRPVVQRVGKNWVPPNEYIYSSAFDLFYHGDYWRMDILFRGKPNVPEKVIAEAFPKAELSESNVGFGMGEIYKFALGIEKSELNSTMVYLVSGTRIVAYASTWPSDYTRDIMTFYFQVTGHALFDGCLIQIMNAWPPDEAIPYGYGMSLIEAMLRKDDIRVEGISEIIAMIRSLVSGAR
jgi:hypothetical protein